MSLTEQHTLIRVCFSQDELYLQTAYVFMYLYLHTAIPPPRLRRWHQWWLFCPLPPQTCSANTGNLLAKPTAASSQKLYSTTLLDAEIHEQFIPSAGKRGYVQKLCLQ